MAAYTAPRPGTGATLAFTTNDYAVRIKGVEWSGYSRPALETTYLASSEGREYIPGDLYEPGQMDVEFDSDPNLLDALKTHLTSAATDTVTLTFDQETGETSACSVAVGGFIIDHSLSVVTEEVVSGSFSIKLTGTITNTDAA